MPPTAQDLNYDPQSASGPFGISAHTNNPNVNVADNTNANLKSGVANQVAIGNQSQADIAARTMQGTDKSGQLATQGTLQQQNQGLGGDSDPGMQAAIANRQNKMFGSSLNELQTNANISAAGQQMKQQSAGMQAEAALEQQKQQLINQQMVKYQNDQAQRNQILTSILQIGGMAIGAGVGAMAGNPSMGAQMGGAVGGGAAKAAQGPGKTEMSEGG